ncbi:hypothetical protein V8J88_11065 [Massilia sp. W12]|uniref:hypothetical protein n=1 Tax=Massilia sp. W12 TaxID=3126507 RepID=UPI0030CE22BB
MRPFALILCLSAAACSAKTEHFPSPAALRSMEHYAIASCFAYQGQPYLKDQGDAWAAVLVQGMSLKPDDLAKIAAQVKLELGKGEMAVMRDETNPGRDKILPVQYCVEIIDKPGVREVLNKLAANSAIRG